MPAILQNSEKSRINLAVYDCSEYEELCYSSDNHDNDITSCP